MPADRSLFSRMVQGSKFFSPRRRWLRDQRLDGQRVAAGQRQLGRRGDLGVERAQAHVQPGLREDLHQPRDIGQIEHVAGGFRESAAGSSPGTDLLDRGHRRLHRQRQDPRTSGCSSRRERDWCRPARAGTRHCARPPRRRAAGVLHPLQAEPALDRRHRVQHARFQFVDRAVQGGDEMGNHGGRPARKRKGRTDEGNVDDSRKVRQMRGGSKSQGPPWGGGPCGGQQTGITSSRRSRRAR